MKAVGIEIITNAICGRKCPGCNQSPFMVANPNYEYTVADAHDMIQTIRKLNIEVRLFFSGGEPALWHELEAVMLLINSCELVKYTQVATSVITQQNIERMKKYFEKVCCSVRSDTAEYLKSPPPWLKDVRLWDQRLHTIDGPPAERIACACAQQGIEYCLIGKECWPCTLAKSNTLLRKAYFEPETLEKVLNHSPWGKIATYAMCRTCSNNGYFRFMANKQPT